MTDTRITDFEAVAPMPIYTQADLDAAVQKERECVIGAGNDIDGQMRLQLVRWELGTCFIAVKYFSEEKMRASGRDLLRGAVDALDDKLDIQISNAIRARTQHD